MQNSAPHPPSARSFFDLQVERAYLRFVITRAERHGADPQRIASIREKITQVESTYAQQLTESRSSPMNVLIDRFSLTDLVVDFLWSAVALVADPRVLPLAHDIVGTSARRGISLCLYSIVAHLNGQQCRDLALALHPGHALFASHLLENTEHAVGAMAMPLGANRRLVSFLAGDNRLDPELSANGGFLNIPEQLVHDQAQRDALVRMKEALDANDGIVVVVEGPADSGRRTAAACAAKRTNGNGHQEKRCIAIDVSRLTRSTSHLQHILDALHRDCVLHRAIPVVSHIEELLAGEDGGARMRILANFLENAPDTAVVTTAQAGLDLNIHRSLVRIAWPIPDTQHRSELWKQYLGGAASNAASNVEELAMRYRLGAGGIARAVKSADLIANSRGNESIQADDIIEGVRNNIAEKLGGLAQRITVKQEWNDLVLAEDTMDQINALIARARHSYKVYEEWQFVGNMPRGVGVPVLFSGPPGTGKTMVAGLIAKELNLELYQVDLSQVISKWVGESEKQLAKIFDAAEAGHALLLFDEADSLFSKRTEVKGSTDRYANLGVNYLLQRIESFGSVAILTTNLEASMDTALRRRLAAHVVFWAPDDDEREKLWRQMLSTGKAPLDTPIDYEDLARSYPDMSGANIRNAALAAAFLAAAEEALISQALLDRAAKGEYRNMGRYFR